MPIEDLCNHPLVGAFVVAEHDGRVLMLKKPDPPDYDPKTMWPGGWVFPGGKLDRGETLRKCAEREFREECGVGLDLAGLVEDGCVEVIGKRRHIVLHAFRYSLYAHQTARVQVMEPHKHLELGWFPWGALPTPMGLGNQLWLERRLSLQHERSPRR